MVFKLLISGWYVFLWNSLIYGNKAASFSDLLLLQGAHVFPTINLRIPAWFYGVIRIRRYQKNTPSLTSLNTIKKE